MVNFSLRFSLLFPSFPLSHILNPNLVFNTHLSPSRLQAFLFTISNPSLSRTHLSPSRSHHHFSVGCLSPSCSKRGAVTRNSKPTRIKSQNQVSQFNPSKYLSGRCRGTTRVGVLIGVYRCRI